MMSKAELTERIKKAIAPWRKAVEEPPFTPVELIFMALSMRGGEATGERIFLWIGSTFNYYNKLMVEANCYVGPRTTSRSDRAQRASLAVQDLRSAMAEKLQELDLPLQYYRPGIMAAPVYRTSTESAVHILAPRIGHNTYRRAKTFNFFGLPSELRDIIYDMVFTFPRSGLVLEMHRTWTQDSAEDRKFLVRSRSPNLKFSHTVFLDHRERFSSGHDWVKTRSILDILQPLLVCRQFYDEAMPKFYKLNHFHFPTVATLRQSLIKMPSTRRDQLTDISFNYDITNYRTAYYGTLSESKAAADAFDVLSEMKHLSKLSISVNERAWRTGYDAGRFHKKHSTVMNMEGIEQLRLLRELKEVTFLNCPTLERELKVGMTEPRHEGEQLTRQAKKELRKRRAEEPEGMVLRSKMIKNAQIVVS